MNRGRKALEAAGVKLARGSRSLGTVIPPPVPGPRLPDGAEVVAFFVPGRAIPWKAPTVTRKGGAFKAPKLVAWQRAVAADALRAMIGRRPYGHPVRLSMVFTLRPPVGRQKMADASNLGKACEDALQGIVIWNDSQVVEPRPRRTYGEAEGVMIAVYASEDP